MGEFFEEEEATAACNKCGDFGSVVQKVRLLNGRCCWAALGTAARLPATPWPVTCSAVAVCRFGTGFLKPSPVPTPHALAQAKTLASDKRSTLCRVIVTRAAEFLGPAKLKDNSPYVDGVLDRELTEDMLAGGTKSRQFKAGAVQCACAGSREGRGGGGARQDGVHHVLDKAEKNSAKQSGTSARIPQPLATLAFPKQPLRTGDHHLIVTDGKWYGRRGMRKLLAAALLGIADPRKGDIADLELPAAAVAYAELVVRPLSWQRGLQG